MATTTATCAATNSTDANFRAWVQFIFNVFTNGGWVQTADTGQIDPVTATKPGAVNTKVGYAIFGMNDTLQATHPVFVKFSFGSGNTHAVDPGLWFAVGAATDGAGNLVDSDGNASRIAWQDAATQAPIQLNTSDILPRACLGSAGTDRAGFVLFEAQPVWAPGAGVTAKTTPDHIGGESSFTLMWTLERAKDWDGDDVGEYVHLTWSQGVGANACLNKNLYVATSMSEPSNLVDAITGLAYGLAEQGPLTGSRDTPPVAFKNHSFPMPPGINVMLSRIDFQEHDVFGTYQSGTLVDVTSYSVSHRYRVVAGMRALAISQAQDANAHVRILYE